MPALKLKECPKVYMLETHRSRTPESTLQFVENMKGILGMIDFQNATSLDRLGIPVFLCHRIRPDDSRTSHTGKGVSAIQAQVSLTMESIERFCSEYRDEYSSRLIRGSYDALKKKHNTLDPHSLILSSLSDYRPEGDMHWVWGTDLLSQEEILVPACTVYHPFHLDEMSLINTHTNGIAAGNTLEEAVVHGLAEVVERDAWSIAQHNRHFRESLSVEDGAETEFIVRVIEKFSRADIEIVAKNITSDVGVPVIAAFSRDLVHDNMMPIDGFGAHLDPKVAMVRAILEIATTRALFMLKFGMEGLSEAMSGYYREEDDSDPRFFSFEHKRLGEIESAYTDDIHADIRIIMDRLQACGLDRVIAVDLTRPDIGIPTVRMIVPGMEGTCFDRSRRGDRLYADC